MLVSQLLIYGYYKHTREQRQRVSQYTMSKELPSLPFVYFQVLNACIISQIMLLIVQ